MLMSLRLGTNDKAKAKAFYDATFAALGVKTTPIPDEYPIIMYKIPNGPNFSLGAARDGNPATYANGGTILFSAPDEKTVDAWYAAGLANGGTCEGEPGPREKARGAYGAYLRDPDGNKLGVYFGLQMS